MPPSTTPRHAAVRPATGQHVPSLGALALLAAAALFAGCGGPTPEEPATPAYGDIQRIFDQSCALAGCHDGMAGERALTELSRGVSHFNLVNRPSTAGAGLTLVVPGDPDGSYLLCTIDPACTHRVAGSVLMPKSAPPLATESLEAVRRWIAGGALGDDSQPIDAGPDVTAPVFAGLATATASGEHAIDLTWQAAVDLTPPARLRYRVYVATTPGGQDFGQPSLTVTGMTAATVTGLDAGVHYRVVVRAVDEAGNEDTNTIEKDAVTPDQTAPEFAGVVDATAPAPRTIDVTWAAAVDNVTAPGAIRYRVYLATTAGGQDLATPATTVTGATSATIANLLPSTTYHVVVRAEDEAGNRDGNLIERAIRTLDTVPPTFGGVTGATGGANTVQLTWAAASDDTTAAADMVYLVYRATTAGGQSFAAPTYTTPPGVTSFAAGGLAPSTTYHFVVRARDQAGNVDANVVERSATTNALVDVQPPMFTGASGAVATGATTIRLSWNAASDNVTPAGNLVYLVYRANAAGGQSFAAPTYTTAPGATTFDAGGLAPTTRYFFVVRARDLAGNIDANTMQVDAQTAADTTAPAFAGLATASPVNATSIALGWNAATDDVSPAASLVYDVYRATTAGGESFAAPTYTSAAGATSLVATGLQPATTYYFVVRARDQAGNRDSNVVERMAQSGNDVTAPVFAGVTNVSAGASPDRLVVSWNAATDNIDPPGQLSYLLYVSQVSGGQSFVNPTATTAPGATTFTLTGLSPATTYFVVVRARDVAGNVDSNVVERSGTTLADTTAPTFGGASGATAVNGARVNVTWQAGSDDITPANQLVYLVYVATAPGAQDFGAPPAVTTAAGVLSARIGGLDPSTQYFVVVRARDAAGNVDTNTAERAVSTSAPTIGFAAQVQPIFSASCAVPGCHTGQFPSQGLDLASGESRAALVNVLSSECGAIRRVLPGSSAQSYLAWKLVGSGPCFVGGQMPLAGAITAAQRDTIIDWIDEGALDN